MSHPITAERLRQLVDYNPETGIFTRKVRNTNSGSGWQDKAGYLYLMIDGKTYAAHRLAWLHTTGVWPTDEVDHLNGKRDDNRFENLRDTDRTVNMQNTLTVRKNNAVGLMGVHWRKDRSRWVASIRVEGKSTRLGAFKTPEEAAAAYLEGKRRYHPGFTG